MATKKDADLYKVLVETRDHPHVLEILVSAESASSASEKALGHIKAANPTKGRPLEISQNNSKVLSARKAGKNGCITINKLPVAAFKEAGISMAKNKKGRNTS